MGSDQPDRTLPRERIARMVQVVRPTWRLREATLAGQGWTAVYHLVVEMPEGRRRCVLKAAPDVDRPTGIDTEARIQAVAGEHTSIPVPTVFGAVDGDTSDGDASDRNTGDGDAVHGDASDEDETLRTPFFLMESLPGERVPMAALGELPDRTVERVASETGRYLGQLHGLDVAFESFGKCVGYRGGSLRGDRPSGDPAQLVASEGSRRWSSQLRDWFEEDLARLEESRFADLAPALRAELARRLDAVPESVRPVLGRVDHGWFNLLLDRETATLSGVIDWGSRFAVPPSFDLAVVEYLLAGGWWTALPEVPDRRPLVREALLAGYREEATVPATLAAQRACYQLDDLLRWMAVLEPRAGVSGRVIPPDRVDEAAAGYRAAVEEELQGPTGRR